MNTLTKPILTFARSSKNYILKHMTFIDLYLRFAGAGAVGHTSRVLPTVSTVFTDPASASSTTLCPTGDADGRLAQAQQRRFHNNVQCNLPRRDRAYIPSCLLRVSSVPGLQHWAAAGDAGGTRRGAEHHRGCIRRSWLAFRRARHVGKDDEVSNSPATQHHDWLLLRSHGMK